MKLTVYCGANKGNNPACETAAKELGTWMAAEGIGLVYGGGKAGLMGILAGAVLAGGGNATGVIPRFLKTAEQAHTGLTKIITVETMAERKEKMLALGDAVLALPGGPGTLEEISEAYSARRLRLHEKPCLIYNVAGCCEKLKEYLDEMVRRGFLTEKDRALLIFADNLEEIKTRLPLPQRK